MHPPKNRLWAPWRLQYVKGLDKKGGCFFCRYVKEKKDRKNLVIKRSKKSFCVVNKYPYNNGHLLIAPMRHTGKIESLKEEEVLDLWNLMAEMKKRLQKIMKPHGYNIGFNLGRPAGAGVPGHLHLHIVPRWNGDTNYMPVVGKTKVMPMALEECWKVLTRPR